MKALVEEVIRALGVPEIAKLPRFVGDTTIPYQLLNTRPIPEYPTKELKVWIGSDGR